MTGSDIEQVLQLVYGKDVVPHISGKAISRALRRHFMVEAGLNNILLTQVIPPECKYDIMEEVKQLFDDLEASAALSSINSSVNDLMDKLSIDSRTAKLWISYIRYVEVAKLFIRAERLGDWHLHLYAMSQIMNLFAATGHVHYAKSSRMYLQMMYELPDKYP